MANSLVLLVTSLVALAGCGAPPAQPPTAAPVEADAGGTLSPEPSLGLGADTSEVRLIAVGDIADCTVETDERVAALVAGMRGKIATLGDTVYPNGSPEDFKNCFAPKWGALTPRMFPSIGNHEYQTEGATGYFGYFADAQRLTGDPAEGWYAYDLSPSWRAISLNSNCGAVRGCTADSPQGQWLASELEAAGDRNVLAYWHAPRYSGGQHGSIAAMKPFFRMLYQARADLVLNGHDHSYERFAPQNASGDYRRRGVQQFVVGTGGRSLYKFEPGSRLPNTRARNDETYGVLKLRLRPDGYSWRFVPAAGGDFTDSGSRTLE